MRRFPSIFFIAASLLILSLLYIYYFINATPLAKWTTDDLIRFATYFGGVALPALTLLTVYGLAFTLKSQSEQLAYHTDQIEELNQRGLEDQYLRMLDNLIKDMTSLESQRLSTATLGEVLQDESLSHLRSGEQFSHFMRSYFALLVDYAQSVDLYRENITPYFACRIFANRGLRLLKKIAPYTYDCGVSPATTEMIRDYLEGELAEIYSDE